MEAATERIEEGRFRPAFAKDGRLSSTTIAAAKLAPIVEGIELVVSQKSNAREFFADRA
jgi:hypothetical protein